MASFAEFKNIEMRVGRVKEVKDHPNADKLYVITADLGTEERELVAGVKQYYKPDELMGKLVVVVTNLEPATIRGVESKGMLLASKDDKGLSILTLDKEVALGSVVS